MTFWGVVLFFVCWREGDGMAVVKKTKVERLKRS